MKPLGFRIERIPYHPSSGLTGEMVQKIRDDGRIGAATADELALWCDLEIARAELAEARGTIDRQALSLKALADERDKLRDKLAKQGAKRP